MMKYPLIVINFKAYKTAVGNNAVKLAKVCEKVASATNANIAVAVQTADISSVSKAVKIPILAQHIDTNEQGAYTGSILAESIKENGASGTLLNHSERKLQFAVLGKTIKRAKSLSLNTIVCASTPAEAKKIAKLNPDFIAIEPPELIGGNISVSEARPEVVTATTSAIKRIPIVCGAGIHTKEDVEKAVKLGVKGILVASGVTNAKNPEKILRELVVGLK